MSCKITVFLKNQTAGGVLIEEAPMARIEYFLAFTKSLEENFSTFTIKDVHDNYFVFVPTEIQGLVIEGL